jgi:hypothetical protein
MKSPAVDLGPATGDLAPMEGSNAGNSEGSHHIIPGRSATGIKRCHMGAIAMGKKSKEHHTYQADEKNQMNKENQLPVKGWPKQIGGGEGERTDKEKPMECRFGGIRKPRFFLSIRDK